MSKVKQKVDVGQETSAPQNVFAETKQWHQCVWGKLGDYATSRGVELPPVDWDKGFTEHGKSLKSRLGVQLIFSDATVGGEIIGIVRFSEGFDANVVESMASVMPMALNGKPDRNQKCRDFAKELGFEIGEGGLRNARPGKVLREKIDAISEEAGPYPHKGVRFEVLNERRHKLMTGASKTQKGRMHKVACDRCGLIVRQSQGAIDEYGIAWCPRHQAPMTVHYKEGEEPDVVAAPEDQGSDNEAGPERDDIAARRAAEDVSEPAERQDNAPDRLIAAE